MGSVYFYFCPSRAVLVSAGLGKASSSGRRAPVAGWGGVGRRSVESFVALANLAAPHAAAVARSFLRTPLGGRPRGTEPGPSRGPESFPEVTPKPRPQGMLSAPLEPFGSGDGRLDRVGFNLGTELARSPSPAGKALRGWGEGGGTGMRLRGRNQPLRVTFQAASDVSRRL